MKKEEAIKILREVHDGSLFSVRNALETFIPELKESEDERIRKELLCHIQGEIDTYDNMVSGDYDSRDKEDKKVHSMLERAKAYLEKQKEQKITINIEHLKSYLLQYLQDAANRQGDSEIHADTDKWAKKIIELIGVEEQKEQIPYIDFVIKPHKGDDDNPYDMSVSEAQEYAFNRGFDILFNDGEVYVDERHMTQTIGNILRWADEHPKEHKPNIELIQRSWYMQGYYDGKYSREPKWIIKTGEGGPKHELNPRYGKPLVKEQKPAEWSLPKDFEEAVYKVANFISPFDSQDELRKVSHCFAEQLMSLAKKELMEKPAEWSEEDETHRAFILESLEDQIRFCKKDAEGAHYAKQIRIAQNWLKFLHPHSNWKPKKEQIEALKNAAFGAVVNGDGPYLRQLYNELKKL